MRHDVERIDAVRRLGEWLCVAVAGSLLAACYSPPDAGHRIYGYVDAQGHEVVAPAFLDALPFHEGLAAVKVGSGWGYIDSLGHWAIQPVYLAAGSFADDRAPVRDVSGLWGYVDRSGRMVIAPKYRSAGSFFNGRAVAVLAKDRTQLIDRDGRVLAETAVSESLLTDAVEDHGPESYIEFSERQSTADTLDAARAGSLPSTTPRSAEFRIALQTEDTPDIESAIGKVDAFVDGLARAESDGKIGFIDRRGQVVVPLQYSEALRRFSRDRTVVVHDGHAWLIDPTGRDIADLGVWPWPGLAEEEGFDDLDGYVGDADFFADGLMPWRQGDLWGYVGLDGRWLITPQYQWAQPFHAGRAGVQADGRGLLIDVKGRVLARAPRGWWIAPASGELLRAGTETAWGFVGVDGTLPKALPYATVRIIFAGRSSVDARPLRYSEGLAAVTRTAPHRWQVVDADGRVRAGGRYDWVEDAGAGLYAVAIDQRWALASSALQVLSGARFDAAPDFAPGSDAQAAAWRDRRLGCMDRRGQWRALPAGLDDADCRRPLTIARTSGDSTNLWGVLDAGGRWVLPPVYEEIDALDHPGRSCFMLMAVTESESAVGRVACIANGRVRYSEARQLLCASDRLCFLHQRSGWRQLDLDSLQDVGPDYDNVVPARGDRATVRQGSRWGLLDSEGRSVLPVEYDSITLANPDFATPPADVIASRGGLWGVAPLVGLREVAVRYDAIQPLGGDFYAARAGAQWGVVRSGGGEVIAPRFESILALRGELLLVSSGGRLDLVTLDGRSVLQPSPPWLQRIHQLADFSPEFWAVFTVESERYFIHKATHAVHRLDPPAGYAWVFRGSQQQASGAVAGFYDAGFDGAMDLQPIGLPTDLEDPPEYAVLVAANGQRLPQVFDRIQRADDLPQTRYFVYLRGKCGVVDEHGRFTVPVTHDHCEETVSGLILLGDEDR